MLEVHANETAPYSITLTIIINQKQPLILIKKCHNLNAINYGERKKKQFI